MKDIYVRPDGVICACTVPFPNEKDFSGDQWKENNALQACKESAVPFENQIIVKQEIFQPPLKSKKDWKEFKPDTFYQIEADWEIVEVPEEDSGTDEMGRKVDFKKIARLKVPAPTVATDNSGDIALINLEKLKRVCYHFAGAVHVGHDFNSSDSFDRAWREWVKDGKINPWHSHRDTSKEAVQVTDLISYVKSSPVEEEQDRIATSNKMRDEIIYILENFKGMRATYPLLHLFESKLKEINKTFKPKDSAHQTKLG